MKPMRHAIAASHPLLAMTVEGQCEEHGDPSTALRTGYAIARRSLEPVMDLYFES
jgi:hypothetical protein